MKTKSTRVTSSADVKAFGGPATIYAITIQNSGTAGTAGNVEIRDAQSTPGDTGTLRWDYRHGATDEDLVASQVAPASVSFGEHGLHMPQGIRVTFATITQAIVWVIWEG